jgi:hypothetical protein
MVNNRGMSVLCRPGRVARHDGRAWAGEQGRLHPAATGDIPRHAIATGRHNCDMMGRGATRGDASGGDGFVDHTKRNKPSLLDRDDVLKLLRDAVAKAGNQSAWAREKNINRTAVSAILNGRKNLQPKILAALKLKKAEAYTRM